MAITYNHEMSSMLRFELPFGGGGVGEGSEYWIYNHEEDILSQPHGPHRENERFGLGDP